MEKRQNNALFSIFGAVIVAVTALSVVMVETNVKHDHSRANIEYYDYC